MFKKILLAIALILPISAIAQTKFGVVDLEPIFQSLPEFTAMQTQLTDSSKKYEEEFQKLQDEVNKLYADFQTIQNDPQTPESIKERRMQDIQTRYEKLTEFRNTAEQDLQRLQQQLMVPIHQKVTEAIKAVGQEGSYTFIFPNEPSMLLYQGVDVVNLTEAVKAKLATAAK